jgi:hypothetical protein
LTSSGALRLIVVVLVAGILASSTVAAFYAFQYGQAQNSASVYLKELQQSSGGKDGVLTTDILLDFGNGTQRWYNGTEVQPGWNVYLATLVVTDGNLNATWYPQFGEHLIEGLDGVQNTQSDSWFLWTYNSTSLWQVTQEGADELPASSGSVYAWSYCGVTASFAPACTGP